MKLTQSYTLVKVLLLAVLAAGVSTSLASAQVCEGTFTLPFQARWGQVTLPAGKYSFRLDPSASPYTVTVQGASRGAIVMAHHISDRQDSGRSELLIVRSGGKAWVRALHLVGPDLGQVFVYPLPKGERNYLAQAPQLNQRVPVLMASS
jgi:hypothetical protein